MNDINTMQETTIYICNLLGIDICKIQPTNNLISRYNSITKTIRLRTIERYKMLPVKDAWIHELAHHVQQYIQPLHPQIQRNKHHNSHHKEIIISLLYVLELKEYAWDKEYKSYWRNQIGKP